MKFLICFVFVAIAASAQALTDEQKAKWKKWSEECQVETGASQESILKIRNNQFNAVDDTIKAHALCFSKKSGLADDAGNIVTDQIKEKLRRVVSNEEEIDRIVQKCVVKTGTPENTAFEVFKCIRESKPSFNPV